MTENDQCADDPFDFIDPDTNFFNVMFSDMGTLDHSRYYNIEQCNSALSRLQRKFLVINQNIRSINKNGDKLIAMLNTLYKQPDAIVLTETWHNKDKDLHSFLEGWKAFHTVRHNDGRGGGVSVYVDESRSATELSHLCVSTPTIETCVVALNDGVDLILFAVYRPHSDTIENFNDRLQEMLQDPAISRRNIILVGDFNINLLLTNNDCVVNFMNSLQSAQFLPTITKPTRFAPGVAPSCLDHIWINSLQRYVSGIIHIDLTDHCPSFYCFATKQLSSTTTKVSFRNYKPEYYNAFVNKLLNSGYMVGNSCNINEDTERFCNMIDKAYCDSFPLKIKYVSHKRLQNPWLSSGILKSIKTKANYFKLHKLGLISTEANNKYKNTLTTVIRNAKIRHYQKAFTNCTNDIKQTWKILKSLMGSGRNSKSVVALDVGGRRVTDDAEIAEEFNNYYSKVAVNLDSAIASGGMNSLHYVNTNVVNSFFMFPVSGKECMNVIEKLKNTKCDINAIPVRLFKKVAPILCSTIVELINNSFSAGIFPDCLKKGENNSYI